MLILDLFCGGGGAARGFLAEGHEVVGVDIANHAKAYPGAFVRGDALRPPVRLHDFDFVWASPPCQAYSAALAFSKGRTKHVKLLEPVRELLADHPYTCIENVPGCPLRPDIVLSGPMVGLPKLNRRRIFEISWPQGLIPPVAKPVGSIAKGTLVTVTKQGGIACRYIREQRAKHSPHLNSGRFKKWEMGEACGIEDWRDMTMAEIGECVPPAYSAFIVRDLQDHLDYAANTAAERSA